PAQRLAVPAEQILYRADVGAGADAQVQPDDSVQVLDHVELLDPRAPHRHLHDLTAPVQPVRALACDLHRRGGGDGQLDVAPQLGELPVELGAVRRLALLDDVALRIAGR